MQERLQLGGGRDRGQLLLSYATAVLSSRLSNTAPNLSCLPSEAQQHTSMCCDTGECTDGNTEAGTKPVAAWQQRRCKLDARYRAMQQRRRVGTAPADTRLGASERQQTHADSRRRRRGYAQAGRRCTVVSTQA